MALDDHFLGLDNFLENGKEGKKKEERKRKKKKKKRTIKKIRFFLLLFPKSKNLVPFGGFRGGLWSGFSRRDVDFCRADFGDNALVPLPVDPASLHCHFLCYFTGSGKRLVGSDWRHLLEAAVNLLDTVLIIYDAVIHGVKGESEGEREGRRRTPENSFLFHFLSFFFFFLSFFFFFFPQQTLSSWSSFDGKPGRL